jgi:conjugative relaxase-like TrwC/TraI family protein
MLSVGRIAAGDGYRYLTSQVASHDATRAGERLVSYYERTGMPPGVWAGAQAAAFGLEGAPTEAQMERLYGRCADPFTGALLGRRMAEFRPLAERIATRVAGLGRTPTDEERAAIARSEQARGQPQAVTAFDLTFSAPKSVSILWALGGDEIRDAVQRAHEGAWRDALAHFEADVACTRLGAGGVAQVDVDGVTVAAFEHWFNRSGDPQLHTHLAVSAMVRTAGSGRWRRLDSRAMYRAAASVGERYTGYLLGRLRDDLGVAVRHRPGRGDRLLPELDGINDTLIDAFSSRAAQIDATLARLVGEFTDTHGHTPDRATTARLAQQAALMDRPATGQRSWTAERRGWLERAGQVLGVDVERVGAHVVAAVGRAGPPVEPEPNPMRAETVISRLEERGATWNRRDVEREAAAVLREAGVRVDDRSVTELVAAVVGHEDSVSLDAPDVGGRVPQALRRADGSSVFTRRGEQLYTSTTILAAERELAALAAVRSQTSTEAARRYRAGWAELDDDDLVRRVAGAGTRIVELDTQIRRADAATPALERAAAEATAAAARLRAEMPASSAVRAELAADDLAAARLAEIDRALAVRGLRRPRGRERAVLEDEARALRFERPMITADVRYRAELAAEGLGRAEAVDARALAVADAAAGTATVAASRHRTSLALLVAARSEQAEGRDALAGELAARQGVAGRVSMIGYLDGLGVDQAAAMVRLADPSAPLTALVGPAGSGKTTALAALVRAHADAGPAVHVLAPTAVAATALGAAVGVPGRTIASALRSWDLGRDLPGAGDLVLIDEASMATTLDVRDVVRVAHDHGALVRLIGDPRQARAVGAGGALDLVATAGNAPTLTELHRFARPWEGEASLRLRDGDTGVIDIYAAHGRVRSGSYAAMLEDTYRHYRDLTDTDPAGVVMIVSDNHSVQALSERARADRVAAGRVEPGGVVLHDGSVAGVGDVIVTRRNDRQLRSGPEGFVKNRDRWEVTGRTPDGTLTVRKVGSPATATLPAGYVAEHVELSYALTGYGAQGLTVTTALAVVQPGDERSFAYVAATRGTDNNMIRVVTETLDDEPAGHHPERSARDVLGAVLANEPAVTAGQAVEAAAARHDDAAELLNRHRHTTRTLAEQTLATVLEARGASDLLGAPDAWLLIDEAERSTARGLDAAAILATATDDQLATVEHATQVLRLERLYPTEVSVDVPYPALVAGLVPATAAATPPDVAAYLDGLTAALTRRHDTLAAQYQTGPAPAWAASFGQPPSEPAARAAWADNVAQVGLWREAHNITTDDPLGPSLPLGHRDGAARTRAANAADQATELATGRTVNRTSGHTRYSGAYDPAPPAPTPQHDRHLGR